MTSSFFFSRWAVVLALFVCCVVPLRGDKNEVVLVMGPDFATRAFVRHVVTPLGWEAVEEEAPLDVSEYAKYGAVILVERFPWKSAREEAFWNTGTHGKVVHEYVSGGGKVIIVGAAWPRKPKSDGVAVRNLAMLEPFLGFGYYPNHPLVDPVLGQPAGEALFHGKEFPFVAPYSVTVDKITTAKVLATVCDEKGRVYPFATVNEVGEGRVFWFSTSPFRLVRESSAEDSVAQEYFHILQAVLKE